MDRQVLFVTVPAAESCDLLEIRAYVLESLAAGVLILGPGVEWAVVTLPELGDVVIASPPTPPVETVCPPGSISSPPNPAPGSEAQGYPAFTGAGAKEKRLICDALHRFRAERGLGCLRLLTAQSGTLTEDLLRAALRGAKIPIETWRLIGKALDALSGKPEGTYGET